MVISKMTKESSKIGNQCNEARYTMALKEVIFKTKNQDLANSKI